MIKYLGSKRTLLPSILAAVSRIRGARTVVDLFSGTSRVGHALKRASLRVLANDHNTYAHTLATCYVQADRERTLRRAEMLVNEFNRLPGRPGYFADVFCTRSRYFQPKNGARIDAIRDAIDRKSLGPELKAVMLVSLMEAADRVDSTTGLQMAYLKSWSARSHNDLALRVPDLLPRAPAGKGRAYGQDALTAAAKLEGDIAYIDPPYNQHSYLGNYHVWETLIRWDAPEPYGIACKRADCRVRRSDFNLRNACRPALEAVLRAVRCPTLIISFSNEGHISRTEMETMLASLPGSRRVQTIAHDYKRYVGAQIGIYNPKGEKVGKVSHLRNTEYLYIVSDRAE